MVKLSLRLREPGLLEDCMSMLDSMLGKLSAEKVVASSWRLYATSNCLIKLWLQASTMVPTYQRQPMIEVKVSVECQDVYSLAKVVSILAKIKCKAGVLLLEG